MKLVSLLHDGENRIGRVNDNRITLLPNHQHLIDLIRSGHEACDGLAETSSDTIDFDEATLRPPVGNPSKIIAVGLNYIDHTKEGGAEQPERPMIFAKYPNTLVGHRETIHWSEDTTQQVDYEAELVVVIGRSARRVSEAEALGYVFGYCCGNDVSARDIQISDKQWTRGKSLDTFGPIGPWIVTADEVPDPQSLDIACYVNGQKLQESNTKHMVFSIANLISFLSHSFTLEPGDLIFTGTPHGVGAFRTPPIFLRDGDEVVVEIQHVGRLVNSCRTD